MSPYLFVFFALIAGGLGFPMPEELPLLFAGFSIHQPEISVWAMLAVCYVGVMIGDTTMFFFGYFFGNKLLDKGTRSPFLPLVTPEKVEEVREGLRKKRLLYLFIGRHLFFLRSVTFLVAGAIRMPFPEFFISDSIAAIASVSVFVSIGYLFGKAVPIERMSHLTHQAFFVLFLALGGGMAIYYLIKRYRRSKSVPPSP